MNIDENLLWWAMSIDGHHHAPISTPTMYSDLLRTGIFCAAAMNVIISFCDHHHQYGRSEMVYGDEQQRGCMTYMIA